MFRCLDEQRDFTLVQGMKKPAYKRISTRQLLDEVEFRECDLQRDYLKRVIDVMDRDRVNRLNG